MEIYNKIIEELTERNEEVATMESCTGGYVASEITNHPGASAVLKFSAVTYSNEYKIKMGVDEAIIDKYGVYGPECAVSMAKAISEFAESDYGIGITGKINTPDPANNFGEDDSIFIAICNRKKAVWYCYEIPAMPNHTREENKENITSVIGELFSMILNNDKELESESVIKLTKQQN